MTWTFPPHLLEETRRVDAARFAARLATMTRAEVIALHVETCARVEAAILAGCDMWPTVLDEVAALQECRAFLEFLAAPAPRPPSPHVTVDRETAYGFTFRMTPIRVF